MASSLTGFNQLCTIISSILMLIIALTWLYITKSPKECNLTSVSNRNFNYYYGLVNVDNPLSYYSAEQPDSINSKCRLFYDSMHLFPSGDRSLSKSMIVQALRGSGKTHMRQCIIARLPPTNQILIKIYGVDINNYLENFVQAIDFTSEPSYEKIRKYWTKEHFLQVILTEIVTRFVNEKYLEILKQRQNFITLQTRKEIAVLLSFYYTKDPGTLCKMINLLLHEITECSILDCSMPCENPKFNNGDQEMFIELTQRHNKIKVKRYTTAVDSSLKVLLAMYTKTKYSPLSTLDRSYRDQLASLINFLSTLHIATTVIVDSLDESIFFFNQVDTNLRTLQTFIDSITNDDILHLALGNWGESNEMKNSFAFYIFIPKKPNVLMNISWNRQDKIPIIDLKWDELRLINYVDYIFDYLRSKTHHQCKSLPDICSLLGGRKLCIHTIKQFRHPRDFHIFFGALIQHMNIVCRQRDSPFIAIEEDLKIALAETKLRILEE
ncbi:unnamed protein product [Rotaria sordida]|uniref:Uncharacterized protein n=1 Tax=Rotaria sordida TaxID=392033 RepID=A0A819HQH8_9BILA|nr:unnamed protein product [Rotaria sordida]